LATSMAADRRCHACSLLVATTADRVVAAPLLQNGETTDV
jgi:coenzyme F420-reducing hydrogenase beta subunit